jgi:predicted RNA-binding Zn ribbon-like protein
VDGRPTDLTTVERFLNTLDQRTFVRHGSTHTAADALSSVDDLARWLQTSDLPHASISTSDLEAARSLREGLRAVLLADQPAADALARFPVRLRTDGDGRLRLAADTGTPGLDPLVETVARTVADGSFKRLKLCASDDCHWAFVDTSRSGGGRWCSMEICGNRHKTRAYRRRTA